MYIPTFRLPGGSLFSFLPKEIVPFDPLRDLVFPKEDKKKDKPAPASAAPSQSLAPINPQNPLDIGAARVRRRNQGSAKVGRSGAGKFGNAGPKGWG